jgi:hypothetical protein
MIINIFEYDYIYMFVYNSVQLEMENLIQISIDS